MLFLFMILAAGQLHASAEIVHDVSGRVFLDGRLVYPRLSNEHRAAMGGVSVTLRALSDGAERVALTDEEGLYSFDCVATGEYELVFECDTCLKTTVRFDYRHPSDIHVDQLINFDPRKFHETRIPPNSYWVPFHIVDEDTGDALPSTRVTLANRKPESTDECGDTVLGLEPGTYSFTVEKSDYGTIRKEVVVEKKDVYMTVPLQRNR